VDLGRHDLNQAGSMASPPGSGRRWPMRASAVAASSLTPGPGR